MIMIYKESGLIFLAKIMILTIMFICFGYLLSVWIHFYYTGNKNISLTRRQNYQNISTKQIFDAALNVSLESNLEASSKKIKDWMKTMEIRYSKTIKHIEDVCRKYNIGKPETFKFDEYMIDVKHQLAYCANAKVGSTTWINHFNSLLPVHERPFKYGTSEIDNYTRNWIRTKFLVWSLYSAKKNKQAQVFSDLVKTHNMTVFTFVRHPFERLVSAYNDKIDSKHSSFPRFVETLIENFNKTNTIQNNHWKPFIQRCNHCLTNYTIVGRMETFQQDVQYIILKNKLEKFLPLNTSLQFVPLNSSKKDTKKETIEKFSQLNDEQIRKLYAIYKLDFELFDYDIDVYLNPIKN